MREEAEKPAEVKSIGPCGNRYLISGQETECRADAMNRRPIAQMITEIDAEFFLRAVADGNDNVRRFLLFDMLQQNGVGNFARGEWEQSIDGPQPRLRAAPLQ